RPERDRHPASRRDRRALAARSWHPDRRRGGAGREASAATPADVAVLQYHKHATRDGLYVDPALTSRPQPAWSSIGGSMRAWRADVRAAALLGGNGTGGPGPSPRSLPDAGG